MVNIDDNIRTTRARGWAKNNFKLKIRSWKIELQGNERMTREKEREGELLIEKQRHKRVKTKQVSNKNIWKWTLGKNGGKVFLQKKNQNMRAVGFEMI